MKKLIPLLIVAMFVAVSVVAQATTVTLWADNKAINAGDVVVSISGPNLVVEYKNLQTYTPFPGPPGHWVLMETHLYVGTECPERSAPGRFPYKNEGLAGASSDTYTIPLVSLTPDGDGNVCIAAQAELLLLRPNDDPYLDPNTGLPIEESGWADGDRFGKKKNWAMCFKFSIP